MKALLLILSLVLLPLQMMAGIDDGLNQIDLKKMLNDKKKRSLAPDNYIPVRAETLNSALLIYFDAPVGDTTITLYKDGFVVSQRLVSVLVGDMENFDLSSWETGEYSLMMTTEQGDCIYGNFLLGQ